MPTACTATKLPIPRSAADRAYCGTPDPLIQQLLATPAGKLLVGANHWPREAAAATPTAPAGRRQTTVIAVAGTAQQEPTPVIRPPADLVGPSPVTIQKVEYIYNSDQSYFASDFGLYRIFHVSGRPRHWREARCLPSYELPLQKDRIIYI